MAQRVKAPNLTTYLLSIPGSHVAEERMDFHELSFDPYMYSVTDTHQPTLHAQLMNEKIF